MTCLTASDLSLIENLEQQLHSSVTVSLLAELERELLRLRTELANGEWAGFCQQLPKRRLFDSLRLGASALRRSDNSLHQGAADMWDAVTDELQNCPLLIPSPAQIIGAWEYSLPSSRSVRARRAHFWREIAEVMRTTVAPRVLVLGGRLPTDALETARITNTQFVLMTPGASASNFVCPPLVHDSFQVESGMWLDLPTLQVQLGQFDLIYSPNWLDCCDDRQVSTWLSTALAMLKPGGRLMAANFTPGSRDAGWMEACWNWYPHYRSEEQLARVVLELESPGLRGHTIIRDESGASAFLEVHAV